MRTTSSSSSSSTSSSSSSSTSSSSSSSSLPSTPNSTKVRSPVAPKGSFYSYQGYFPNSYMQVRTSYPDQPIIINNQKNIISNNQNIYVINNHKVSCRNMDIHRMYEYSDFDDDIYTNQPINLMFDQPYYYY